jgi:hypothetical protein
MIPPAAKGLSPLETLLWAGHHRRLVRVANTPATGGEKRRPRAAAGAAANA